MSRGRAVTIAVALALGAVAFAAAVSSDDMPGPDVASTAPAVRTDLPGLAAPTGDAGLSTLATLTPLPGTAVQAHGPFDDRLDLGSLRFDGQGVSGTLTVVSDVSDILELEVLAGFYDRDGRLIGTARHVVKPEDASHATNEAHPLVGFTIAVPTALHGSAVSAGVGVPVLVNE